MSLTSFAQTSHFVKSGQSDKHLLSTYCGHASSAESLDLSRKDRHLAHVLHFLCPPLLSSPLYHRKLHFPGSPAFLVGSAKGGTGRDWLMEKASLPVSSCIMWHLYQWTSQPWLLLLQKAVPLFVLPAVPSQEHGLWLPSILPLLLLQRIGSASWCCWYLDLSLFLVWLLSSPNPVLQIPHIKFSLLEIDSVVCFLGDFAFPSKCVSYLVHLSLDFRLLSILDGPRCLFPSYHRAFALAFPLRYVLLWIPWWLAPSHSSNVN